MLGECKSQSNISRVISRLASDVDGHGVSMATAGRSRVLAHGPIKLAAARDGCGVGG